MRAASGPRTIRRGGTPRTSTPSKARPFVISVSKLAWDEEYASEGLGVALAGSIEADVRIAVAGRDIRQISRTRQSMFLLASWIENIEQVKKDLASRPRTECELTALPLGPLELLFTRDRASMSIRTYKKGFHGIRRVTENFGRLPRTELSYQEFCQSIDDFTERVLALLLENFSRELVSELWNTYYLADLPPEAPVPK